MSKYPKIKDKNFNKKIYKVFKDYRISKTEKTFDQICFPNKYKLQLPQQFVSNFINPKTKYNGLLIYHQIGAGKTCAALNIAENFKGKKKIIIVTPASLVGNMYKELNTECVGNTYLSKDDANKLKKLNPSSKEYLEILRKSEKKVSKFYKIYSYHKFINLYEDRKINLNNSILIIDEVQNIISEKGTFYKMFYEAIYKGKDNKVVVLSGTPIFDKPSEIGLVLNLLKIPEQLPIGNKFNDKFIKISKCKDDECDLNIKNINLFKKLIKGHVSFYRGAPPIAFPKKKFNLVYCNMSEYQYKSYLTVTDNEGFKTGEILKLPNNFFIGSRIISNIAFPKKKINEEGFNQLKGSYLQMGNLKQYSIKFYAILKKIKKANGLVFIYSNFKSYGGIMSFAKVLDNNGFKSYKDYGEGRNRYAIWSGDENRKLKDEIRDVFNQKSNYNGEKIKIILGSPSIKEGVTLLRISEVHILEPYWNYSLLEQVIGRAVRYCSHKDMPKSRRKVNIYLYLAIHKTNKKTIDTYILDLANKKKNIIDQFEKALKEVAVDCKLNYHGNVYSKKDELKCSN